MKEGRKKKVVLKNANFCPRCGAKLNEICKKCWVKNRQSYSCGFKKCPGYRLPILENIKKAKESF